MKQPLRAFAWSPREPLLCFASSAAGLGFWCPSMGARGSAEGIAAVAHVEWAADGESVLLASATTAAFVSRARADDL